MPRYRVDEAHFLDNKYVEAGTIVDWNGPPSRHMTPVEKVAEERKARYDADRPHVRASRDLPPRVAVVRDVMQRKPGIPRVAGPPGQEPAPPADPQDPQRTMEIVEDRQKFEEQDAKLREEALQQPEEPAPRAKAADELGDTHEGEAQEQRRATRPKPSK